jgi:lactoylglutathione lyase
MKLNHLNLPVNNVPEMRAFFEKYFGFKPMENGADPQAFDMMRDDDGLILSLMRLGNGAEVTYPTGFHVGFVQDSEEKVNQINQLLKDDGYDVKPARRFHGSWTFYFQSPGGFLIEVLC